MRSRMICLKIVIAVSPEAEKQSVNNYALKFLHCSAAPDSYRDAMTRVRKLFI